MFDLTGKTALVTGAASGIGEAIAHALAHAGAHVFVTDRDDANGARVTKDITSAGKRATFLHLDVTSETDCRATEQAVGSLDILVNNAGVGHVGTMQTTNGADLDRLYAVNVRGAFNVTKVFIDGMVARRSGAIVITASIAGVVGIKDRLAYTTTKAALIGLTKAMAIDHAMDGVRVNCVCPGRVETPFVKARLKEYPDPEKAYREMAATQAVGRMRGRQIC